VNISQFQTKQQRADSSEIHRALSIYHPADSDDHFEIRALRVPHRGKVVSGVVHTSEIALATKAAASLSGHAEAFYLTPNPVSAEIRARAPGCLVDFAKITTNDAEITRRSWLLVDFDANRPPGISSTDAEHEAAIERAVVVAEDLRRDHGFPFPLRADSGNGGHLSYRVDLPNDSATTEVFRRFLETLSRRYSDAHVKIDTSVFNTARIWKLPGTMACKGADMPDRPHRMARLIDVPKELEVVKWRAA
jgi:hypothetical protein